MGETILQQLTASDTWGVAAAVAVFGAAGSLVHRVATDGQVEAWWKSALLGLVAAIGLMAFSTPASGVEVIGLSALAGFFARSLLAALESRILLALARQQADRALTLASDAIDLSRRSRMAAASVAGAPEVDLGRLSARLEEVRASGLHKTLE